VRSTSAKPAGVPVRGPSLLTRIRRPTVARANAQPSAKDVREALLQHLQHLCQTRLGSAQASADFGLPDLSESLHSFPDTIATIAQALASAIKKYEPRLANVRVTHVPVEGSELVIRYDVSAQLVGEDDRRVPITFETRIDGSRRVSVT
jgi:type VI secretion system protein